MLVSAKNFYYQYLYPVDPDSMWLLHSLRTLVAALFGLVLAIYIPLSDVFWFAFVLCFAVAIKPLIGANCHQRKRNLLIYCALQAASIFILSLLSEHIWLYAVTVFLLAGGLFYLPRWGNSYTIIAMITMALAIVASGRPTDLSGASWRAVMVFAAIIVAYIYVFYLWPDNFRRAVRKNLNCLNRDLSTYCAWMLRDIARGSQYTSRYSELRQHAFKRYKKLQDLLAEQAYLPNRLRCQRDFAQIMRYQRLFYEVTIMLESYLRSLPEQQNMKQLLPMLVQISQDLVVIFIELQNIVAGKRIPVELTRLHKHIDDMSHFLEKNPSADCYDQHLISIMRHLLRAITHLSNTTNKVMQ